MLRMNRDASLYALLLIAALVTPLNAGPEEHWYRSTFPTPAASLKYHCKKHGEGRPCDQYTKDALDFCHANKSRAHNMTLKDGTPALKIRQGKRGGYFKDDCKIVTFWYR